MLMHAPQLEGIDSPLSTGDANLLFMFVYSLTSAVRGLTVVIAFSFKL